MKILHCADIHLDSSLSSLNNSIKAKDRKNELLVSFLKMVRKGVSLGCEAVLIAGDLFDSNRITQTTKSAVYSLINEFSDVSFYYLKGNHDKNNFLTDSDYSLSNLYCFNSEWKYYNLTDDVIIAGAELSKDNSVTIYNTLNLNSTKFNIVMLHGQESFASASDKTEIVSIRDLKNKAIDYLALGHVHAYKYEKLDGRGYYCYPGCLESRGFDECFTHGYEIIDINIKDKTFVVEHLDDSIRHCYKEELDSSKFQCDVDIINAINKLVKDKNIDSKDMLEVVLVGEVDIDNEFNIDYLNKVFESEFFSFKVKNETKLKVDYESYRHEESLKGEFIRTVEACDELSSEDKAIIIRYGIKALKKEEID